MEDQGGSAAAAREMQPTCRRRAVGAATVLLAFVLLCDAKLWRPHTTLTIAENVQIAEARAWWQGRLDLPERKWDTALYNGKVYSHFPPLFTLLAAMVVPFFDGVPHWFIVLVVVLPVPLLAYAVFRSRTGSAVWGCFLAIGLVCGTSLLPVLEKTLRGAHPYFVNQTLAVSGLLLMLHGALNRRSSRLCTAGLVVSALSRQLTIAYTLPLLWMTWRERRGNVRGAASVHLPENAGTLRFRAGPILLGLMVAVGLPMTLNALKFGHPLDSGYMHVYEGREDDAFARDARTWGIFSPHYVPRNLYFSNLGFPDVHRIEMGGVPETYLRPNDWGTGIWWTTPLLLWVLVLGRQVWADPATRWWLVAAAVVYVALLFYHSTGYRQRGFNRYSLDYVVVLMVLIAPYVTRGWRGWMSAGMIGWSVVYFAWLGDVNIRIS